MATPFESFGIGRLSVAERIVLVQQIWDSIAVEPNQLPLTEAQRQELERRADDDDVNPGDTVPWEQVKAEAGGLDDLPGNPTAVVVLSVFHTSRDPNVWQSRA